MLDSNNCLVEVSVVSKICVQHPDIPDTSVKQLMHGREQLSLPLYLWQHLLRVFQKTSSQ